jgi:hypothetical protein
VSGWLAQPHNNISVSKKVASRLKGFTQVSCSYNSNGGGGGIDPNPKKKSYRVWNCHKNNNPNVGVKRPGRKTPGPGVSGERSGKALEGKTGW